MNNKIDITALFKIGYGLYVLTSNDGKKDNGMIVNTVMQLTDTPLRVGVTINKQNYTHDTVMNSRIMNVSCLSTDAPFSIFENFGFRSGKDNDKFEGIDVPHSENGLPYLDKYANAFLSLAVEDTVDLGTHTMFICTLTESKTLSNAPSMTYAYYHSDVKPKPETKKKTGYVCKICGFVYEDEPLPDDFICPICKHGASDFEKL